MWRRQPSMGMARIYGRMSFDTVIYREPRAILGRNLSTRDLWRNLDGCSLKRENLDAPKSSRAIWASLGGDTHIWGCR